MPCYGPLNAWYPKRLTSNGDPNPDRRLVFKKMDAETGIPLKIPCGKCPGCKLEHSRQWAVRCMHEKRLNSRSAFLTLTYDDANIPPGNTLVKSDLQNFMKRLINHKRYKNDFTKTRFFACGEYGSRTSRPHYHVLLLSDDFPDRSPLSTRSTSTLYKSPTLSKLWPAGAAIIGDVTFESAAYVARYCMKKNQNGKTVNDGRQPEFINMSRNPGLGSGYFSKYKDELISHDKIIVNGHEAALPRFYDNKLAELTEMSETSKINLYTRLELLKVSRRRKITHAQRADSTNARLRIREVVSLAKLRLKGETL